MESREHQLIESLAYYIYLADGCPTGRAEQHWLEAEQLFEVEEQFEVEARLESNILGNEAVEELEMPGLFVETRYF